MSRKKIHFEGRVKGCGTAGDERIRVPATRGSFTSFVVMLKQVFSINTAPMAGAKKGSVTVSSPDWRGGASRATTNLPP